MENVNPSKNSKDAKFSEDFRKYVAENYEPKKEFQQLFNIFVDLTVEHKINLEEFENFVDSLLEPKKLSKLEKMLIIMEEELSVLNPKTDSKSIEFIFRSMFGKGADNLLEDFDKC